MDSAATDRDLLIRAQTGDRAAIDGLVARHHGLVRAACLRQVPAADSDDCVQAVFLVLWRKPSQAARAPTIEAWLVTVARHVCATARRAAAVRARREQEAAMRGASTDATSAEATSAGALLDQLDACLTRLPERQRSVITLHYLAGRSRDEIAVRLGIGVDAVHQHCHRGLARLRDLLGRRRVAVSGAALVAALSSQAHAATGLPPWSLPAAATSSAITYAAGASTAMTATILITSGLTAAGLLVATGVAAIAVAAMESHPTGSSGDTAPGHSPPVVAAPVSPPSAPAVTTDPSDAIRFEAGGLSIQDKATTLFEHGVKMWCGSILLHADALSCSRSPFGRSPHPVIEQLRALPGTHGPMPGRILLDATAVTLPSLGLRGRLTPRRVLVDRQPIDEQRPTLVTFSVHLEDLGDFRCQVRDEDGAWPAFAGRGDHARIEVMADIGGDGLTHPRIMTITLRGRDAVGERGRQLADLMRLTGPVDPAIAIDGVPTEMIAIHARGSEFTFRMDPTGRSAVGMEAKHLSFVKGDFGALTHPP